MDILKQTTQQMHETIEHLKSELKAIRTGRANPAILDGVTVEVYGTQMRIHDIATVSAPEPRQLVVSPFDAGNVHALSKSIEAANLNLQPMVDGNIVRIKVPEMDASVRAEMVKQAKRKGEEAKVGIRNARREGNDTARKQKADGDIPEDLLKKTEKRIQEETDKHCKLADELVAAKEQDITTI